ncbi:hypothetical protein D3C78_1036610 [compost metagenome]
MLLDDLTGPDFCRFLKRNWLLKPRCRDHSWSILILVAFSAFYSVTHTVYQSNVNLKPFRNLDLDCVVRHELRFSGHNCFACCALRKLIHSSYPICLIRDVRQDNCFHEALDKCRFPRANRADDAKINVSAGTLGNVLENIHFFQKRSPPHITPKKKCLKSIDFAFRR